MKDWSYLWMDTAYLKGRRGGRIFSVIAIIAAGVNSDGRREVRLTCTVAPDYLSVSAFSFAPGPAIPKEQWESHNLIDNDIEFD